jgi:hypothetical protein
MTFGTIVRFLSGSCAATTLYAANSTPVTSPELMRVAAVLFLVFVGAVMIKIN